MAQRKFLIDGGFEVNDDSIITGNLTMTGNILPSVDSDGVTGYDLGATNAKWRDLYLSAGSLYVDGQKVLESDAGTIVVQADPDQSLTTKTLGTGILTFSSPNPVAMAATLQMGTGKRITSADGLAVVFGDKVDMDANQIINVGAPTADGHAATKLYVDQLVSSIATDSITEGDSQVSIADLGTGTVGITVDGAQRFALSSSALALTVPVTVNGVELASTTVVSSAVDAATTALEAYADQAEVDAKAYTDARELAITTAFTNADASQTATLEAYADAAEADAIASANAYTDGRETAITTAYQAADTTLQTNINTEKARIDAILATVDADKDTFAEIVTFINSVDTENDTALGTEIAARAAADTTLQGNIDAEATARISGDAATLASAQSYADQAEADAITSANTYTDGRETAITTAYQTYADQAETDAKAYTDTRETAITTAYQTYADQAEADAISTAQAYTDARETAITTAYQTYANTAEADANTYADGIVASEASTRAAADTALDNAKVDKTGAQALHPTDALSIGGNIITLRKGDGTTETVDISPYLDDTNLSRIVSGSMNGSGIATFTRDDTSTFTVDMSILLDDTNLSRITSAAWNTGNGVLTLTRNDNTTVTVDLDGRFQPAGTYDNYVSWTAQDGDGTTYTVTSGDTLQYAEGFGIDVNFTADDVLTISANTTTLDGRYVQPTDLVNFHSGVTTVTQAQSDINDGVNTTAAAVNYTFTDLGDAVHYSVYLNRMLLRPSEYSVSGSTVSIAVGVLAFDDEIEVVGLKLV